MFSVKKRKDGKKTLKISKIPPCPLVFVEAGVYNRNTRTPGIVLPFWRRDAVGKLRV